MGNKFAKAKPRAILGRKTTGSHVDSQLPNLMFIGSDDDEKVRLLSHNSFFTYYG